MSIIAALAELVSGEGIRHGGYYDRGKDLWLRGVDPRLHGRGRDPCDDINRSARAAPIFLGHCGLAAYM
jgi:hypothetical protein